MWRQVFRRGEWCEGWMGRTWEEGHRGNELMMMLWRFERYERYECLEGL